MSCCGKARTRVTTMTTPTGVAPSTTFVFEYVGRTRLVVTGLATRTSYRFDRPGARALVDGRDRASLSTVPLLRQVSG